MAKNKPMSTKEAAKKAKDKAYGTKEVRIYKKTNVKDIVAAKASVNRRAKILDNSGKVISTRYGGILGSTKLAKIKKTDVDAYNLLAKRAKAAGLKGKDAKVAISKSLDVISRQMKTDRGRSATRAEGIAKREQKKRRNTDLTR
jgi:hypothetical protein